MVGGGGEEVARTGECEDGGDLAAQRRRGRGQTCSETDGLSSTSVFASVLDDSGEAGRGRELVGYDGTAITASSVLLESEADK